MRSSCLAAFSLHNLTFLSEQYGRDGNDKVVEPKMIKCDMVEEGQKMQFRE